MDPDPEHDSWQSKPSKPPSGSNNKKPVGTPKEDRAKAPSEDDVADALLHGAGTLTKICRAAFIRRIAPILTPEDLARIGNKWHGAHNKSMCATMMRAAVRFDDIQGLALVYDQLRAKSPRDELEVIGRFLRSGQHAVIAETTLRRLW